MKCLGVKERTGTGNGIAKEYTGGIAMKIVKNWFIIVEIIDRFSRIRT